MATTALDRAAAVRRAVRVLVAEQGFHGAPMSAVARAAGVAVGTAYVHYESKDELVLAAYLEVKRELGVAALDGVDPDERPDARFEAMWRNVHRHLSAEPERARFLVQFDASPFAAEGHRRAMADLDDPLLVAASTPDLADALRPLPFLVLYDLALGPAVRVVARGDDLGGPALDELVAACWRAVTV